MAQMRLCDGGRRNTTSVLSKPRYIPYRRIRPLINERVRHASFRSFNDFEQGLLLMSSRLKRMPIQVLEASITPLIVRILLPAPIL